MDLAQDPAFAAYVPLFATLREAWPEAVLHAKHLVAQPASRRFSNATTGYGFSAALGASLSRLDLPLAGLNRRGPHNVYPQQAGLRAGSIWFNSEQLVMPEASWGAASAASWAPGASRPISRSST